MKNMKNIIVILIILIILILILHNNIYVYFATEIYNKVKNTNSYLTEINMKRNKYKIYYEGFFITAYNPILLAVYKNTYDDFKDIFIDNLDNYVSFTRLNITVSDKVNCDWCSMANGLIKLIINSVKYHNSNNFKKLKDINLLNINFMNNLLKLGLIFRTNKVKKEEINNYINKTFEIINEDIYDLYYNVSLLYLQLEKVELNWCPFRSMTDYYRNTDARYLPINKETLYAAGKILSNVDSIECYLCNKILNKEMDIKYIGSDDKTTSPMWNFYKYTITKN